MASPAPDSPIDLEAEQALLGALLLDSTLLDGLDPLPDPADCVDPLHRQILALILQLHGRQQLADPVTLKGLLGGSGDAGGHAAYLAGLIAGVVTLATVADHARTVRELALRRRLIGWTREVAARAIQVSLDDPLSDQLAGAEAGLFRLATSGLTAARPLAIGQAARHALDAAAAAFHRGTPLTGVTTGLRGLDRQLGGLQCSDLIILAGRPSMGKTALATNIAVAAAQAGTGVLFASLEMSGDQLGGRVLADLARVPSDRLRRGELGPEEFPALVEALGALQGLPLWIDEGEDATVAGLRSRARRAMRRDGVGLIVVDYLQLMRATGRGSDGRVQEVSEITRGLKQLAKELSVPVLALSQLSRKVEEREDKRPLLSDLRESGSIEQDADVVMFVYREDYYLARAEPAPRDGEDPARFQLRHQAWADRLDTVRGQAEIIVAKQRHGPIGTISARFEAALTRFTDPET